MSWTTSSPKITTIDNVDVPLILFFTVAMGIADVISVCGYCEMVTFILKWTARSHPGSFWMFYICTKR
jgi:hypothetical protein